MESKIIRTIIICMTITISICWIMSTIGACILVEPRIFMAPTGATIIIVVMIMLLIGASV